MCARPSRGLPCGADPGRPSLLLPLTCPLLSSPHDMYRYCPISIWLGGAMAWRVAGRSLAAGESGEGRGDRTAVSPLRSTRVRRSILQPGLGRVGLDRAIAPTESFLPFQFCPYMRVCLLPSPCSLRCPLPRVPSVRQIIQQQQRARMRDRGHMSSLMSTGHVCASSAVCAPPQHTPPHTDSPLPHTRPH